jgi:hypothetical protein
MLIHTQFAKSENDILSALRFPNARLAKDRLLPINQLNCYKNDTMLKSFIDGLVNHYDSNPVIDQIKLQQFFDFNDKLDQSRNTLLSAYIPELEQSRNNQQ